MGDEERAQLLDQRTILRAEVGSTAHGVKHSTNDMDEIALYVPPPIEMFGLARPEHYVYRPGRGPQDPSGPGDLDRVYYSLRKFVGLLVAKGNPSALFVLFGPELRSTWLGEELKSMRSTLRTKQTQRAYLGYAMAQRERIQGTRGAAGRIRRSPEGGGEIDWKYAMHMLRLGIQGFEYLTTGHISTPSLELDLLLAVRSGEVSLDQVLTLAQENENKIKALDLPDHSVVDWNVWLCSAHLGWWGGRSEGSHE